MKRYFSDGPLEDREHFDDCPYWEPNNDGEVCTCADRAEQLYDDEMDRRVDQERDRVFEEWCQQRDRDT